MEPVLWALASVVLLNVYAVVLILLRSVVYRVALYRPMLLNVALSFAPVLLAVLAIVILVVVGAPLLPVLTGVPVLGTVVMWIYLVLGTLAWLLFFPNSVYLITELNFSHRREGTPVPLWYDIVQTLTVTVSGLGNAVASLAVAQSGMILIVLDPAGDRVPGSSWLFASTVIVLGAAGVYLGRYLRVNTWDVRHPRSMWRKVREHFSSSAKVVEAVGFVVTHAVLVALIYVPLFALSYRSLLG